MTAAGGRNTTRRDRHRNTIRRGEPPCHICGCEIDYRAGHLDPRSFTIDHIVPLALGGEDTLDNLAAACRKCNRDKSDTPPADWRPPIAFVTARQW
ncbi:HNH endonuclease [Mycobacterium phage Aminay]|uniref:HNH endonuclease n=1 Tax=Mycobacterium phage Aminay TaxID=2250291 RepID=A0A345KV88_9CAUD|nr:HNH endonuclease [Mycobacterium phage Aminay]AXH46940.1 HNH endonuclease [Mycobacterium phage Aminay]